MFACCETGYCESEARAEALSLSMLDLPTEPDDRFVSEDDLPIGAYDDDMDDIGAHLSAYVAGYEY